MINKDIFYMKQKSYIMRIDTSKIIKREKLSGLRGGSGEYDCCKIVCFGEQWSCDQTGLNDCSSVELPDAEHCTVVMIDCDNC